MATMRKSEDHHNTPEQIEAYARSAVEIADACELTTEDRAVLLPAIFGAVMAKQIFYEQAATLPAMAIPRGLG